MKINEHFENEKPVKDYIVNVVCEDKDYVFSSEVNRITKENGYLCFYADKLCLNQVPVKDVKNLIAPRNIIEFKEDED